MSIIGKWISNDRGRTGGRNDTRANKPIRIGGRARGDESVRPYEGPPQPLAPRPTLQQIPAPLAHLGRRVRREGLTYLAEAKLASLLKLALEIEERGEGGTFVEAGCALGGSAIALTATKTPSRPLLVYDVFGMIPPPGPKDGADVHKRYETIRSGQSEGINGNRYYGYETNLRSKVAGAFRRLGYPLERHSVSLIEGLVEETLDDERPVSLAHIDVDWFDPVTVCLERILPRLTPRGAIVLDDYLDWSGCRRAADQFFKAVGREGYSFDDSAGHLVIRHAT